MRQTDPVSILSRLLPERQQWNQHFSVLESLCLYRCPYSPQLGSYLLSTTLWNSQRACLWVMSIFSDIMSLRAGGSFSCFEVQFLSFPGLGLQVTRAFSSLWAQFSNVFAFPMPLLTSKDGQAIHTDNDASSHCRYILWEIHEHTELGMRNPGSLWCISKGEGLTGQGSWFPKPYCVM